MWMKFEVDHINYGFGPKQCQNILACVMTFTPRNAKTYAVCSEPYATRIIFLELDTLWPRIQVKFFIQKSLVVHYRA